MSHILIYNKYFRISIVTVRFSIIETIFLYGTSKTTISFEKTSGINRFNRSIRHIVNIVLLYWCNFFQSLIAL